MFGFLFQAVINILVIGNIKIRTEFVLVARSLACMCGSYLYRKHFFVLYFVLCLVYLLEYSTKINFTVYRHKKSDIE
jgi:hypothetical protein